MKTSIVPVLALAIGIAQPLQASEICAPAPVFYADAALRYQAMLHDTALACRDFADGEQILKYYQMFSLNNEKYFADSLTILDHYYNDGEEAAHLRETERQNAPATILAHMGTARFCRSTLPSLKEAVLDSPRQVQAAVSDFAQRNPGSFKLCN